MELGAAHHASPIHLAGRVLALNIILMFSFFAVLRYALVLQKATSRLQYP